MANKSFPGPNINRIIENDPQIIKIAMDKMDWGARPSTTGKAMSETNVGTIKHTS